MKRIFFKEKNGNSFVNNINGVPKKYKIKKTKSGKEGVEAMRMKGKKKGSKKKKRK